MYACTAVDIQMLWFNFYPLVQISFHDQLCAIIDLPFLKVKKPSFDSMSMFLALAYTGQDDFVDVNFWFQTSYAVKGSF